MGYLMEDLHVIRQALEQKAADLAKEIEAKQNAPLDHDDVCYIKETLGALKNLGMVEEMAERAATSYSANRRYMTNEPMMDRRLMDNMPMGRGYGDDRPFDRDDFGRSRDSRGRFR